MMNRLVVALVLAGACSLPAFASQLYKINFTGVSPTGGPLPSGSLVYDPVAGFSNFFVDWNGATFDLTSSGNAPELDADHATGCTSASSDHHYGFLLMSQTAACTPPAGYGWNGSYLAGSGLLTFNLIVMDAQDMIAAFASGMPLDQMDLVAGNWTLEPVPEPFTLAMGLAGALFLAGVMRRRPGY